MSLFPIDDKLRKAIPLFKYFTRYFPKAHREVTKVCVANNVRYNPDRDPFDINWARGKSPDQLGSAVRHIFESAVDGKVFEEIPPEIAAKVGFDKVYVLAEAMWRIGAALELVIEEQESKAPAEKIQKGNGDRPRAYVVDWSRTKMNEAGDLIEPVWCTNPECPSHKSGYGVCCV